MLSNSRDKEFSPLVNVIDICAVDIFLENRKSRTYVGRLQKAKEKKYEGYLFSYDTKYLYSDKAMALDPNLSLTEKEHFSRTLFTFFVDRIPSRENPAYGEYCDKFGISHKEEDVFVLLSTIGKKGPSSFIFEPVYEDAFLREDLINFRNMLGLTIRGFAIIFDISPSIVHKIESQKSTGRDVLKLVEIYQRFPEVAIFKVERNGAKINSDLKDKLIKKIASQQLNLK